MEGPKSCGDEGRGYFAMDVGPLVEACRVLSQLPREVQLIIVQGIIENIPPNLKENILMVLLQEAVNNDGSDKEEFDPKTMLSVAELTGTNLCQHEVVMRIKHITTPPAAEALARLMIECSNTESALMKEVGGICEKAILAKHGIPESGLPHPIGFAILNVKGKPMVCVKKKQLEAAIGRPVDDGDETKAMKRYSLN